MSDIVSRLILRTEGWDKNLAKAEKSATDFGKDVTAMAGKVAGAIGLAVGATDALQKVISSSQATGDKFAETMEAAKSSVDHFFTALSTGDFTSFTDGLTSIRDKAREAYRAMDQLGNAQMSWNVGSALNMADIQEAQLLAKNKFAPDDVRHGAFEQWKGALGKQTEQNAQLKGDIENYVVKAVEKEVGIKRFKANIENATMATLLDIRNSADRDKLKAKYAKDYETFNAEVKKISHLRLRGSKNEAEDMLDKNKYNDSMEKLTAKYNEAITVNAMLNRYSDEELQVIGQYLIQMKQLDASVASLSREYNETANEYNNSSKKNKGFVPVKSIEGYSVYTAGSQAHTDFNGGTGGGAKVTVPQKKVDETRAAQIYAVVNTQMQYDSPLGRKIMERMSTGKDLPIVKQEVEIEQVFEEEPLPELKDKNKEMKQFTDNLTQAGYAFGALGSLAGGSAGAMMNYFGSIITGAAQAASAIMSLIPVKKMEANANKDVATSGAAASVSSIPVVGWIMAGAAVASVLAAIMNTPKFAKGGVVPGTSWSGDKVPALVNSGEMVLTQGQQKRLFDIANGGGSGVRVSGDVRVSGKDLFISLKNYMNSTGNRL